RSSFETATTPGTRAEQHRTHSPILELARRSIRDEGYQSTRAPWVFPRESLETDWSPVRSLLATYLVARSSSVARELRDREESQELELTVEHSLLGAQEAHRAVTRQRPETGTRSREAREVAREAPERYDTSRG